MNAIHSPTPHPTIAKTGGPGGDPAAPAAGLPDFGALLGLALAPVAGVGAKVMAAGAAMLAAVAAPPPETGGEEANNDAGDGLAAALNQTPAVGGAAAPAAEPGTPTGDILNTGSDKAAGGRSASRAQLAAAAASAGKPAGPAAAQEQAAAAQTQRWNVRELAHHVKAAVGSLGLGEAPAEQGTAPGGPAAASYLAQVGGERIRAAGTQNLLRALAEAGGQGAAPEAAIPPVAAGPGDQDAAGQFQASPDPRFKAALALSAAGKFEEKNPGKELDAPAPAPQAGAPSPARTTPAVDGELRGARLAPMIEQMRQVADFMAERTDGVIRLGQNGTQANLRLDPAELGGVRVQLIVGADRATQTQFIVERPETAALLQQHLRTYQQGLESHGLTVERVQVMVQSARPASGGPDSGWRQQASPDDPRRENSLFENQQQNGRRRNPQAFE